MESVLYQINLKEIDSQILMEGIDLVAFFLVWNRR